MGVLAKPIPFGDYFLLEKINTGGMAEIFKAKTFGVEGFERIVAVKKILPSISEDKEFISMFIDEAKIAGQLTHANIAQIFDLGNINGEYYIALEYVPGHDLRVIFDRCVRTNQKLDIGCVCYIVSKICEGLDYAHNKRDANGQPMNIIHRDISPQNILLSYDGECKLIDFGIAKAANKSSATQVGILKGKFSYMSPEQVQGKPNIDRRSDIFALGIVLFEMLTLKRLFLGDSDFETLEKIRKVEISPPTLYNSDIPDELESIVLKALEKDPDDRYQTAAEFQEALQRFMFKQNIFYTAKELSEFCHSMFAQEIALEQKKMEFYRDLTHDVLMQSKKIASDSEDETSFYDRQNLPKMSGVQYEVVSSTNKASKPAPKEAIYAELDDFQPPTNDIVYSQKASTSSAAPVASAASGQKTTNPKQQAVGRPETYSEIINVPVSTPRRSARRSIVASDVASSKTPETATSKEEGSGSFKVIVGFLMIFIGALCCVAYLRYDQHNGQLQFSVYPADVKVSLAIDDEPKETDLNSPIVVNTLALKKDTHYRVEADGYEPVDGSIRATSELQVIDIQLQPLSATALKFYVNIDGADVFVDGRKLEGNRNFDVSDITPGEHKVTVSKEGYKTEERTIKISKGEQLNQTFDVYPATAVLLLKADPYAADYKVINHRTGNVVKEGKTDKTGTQIPDLPIDDSYDIIITNGSDRIEKSWSPDKKVALNEPQYLVIPTKNNPAAVVPDPAVAAANAPDNTAGADSAGANIAANNADANNTANSGATTGSDAKPVGAKDAQPDNKQEQNVADKTAESDKTKSSTKTDRKKSDDSGSKRTVAKNDTNSQPTKKTEEKQPTPPPAAGPGTFRINSVPAAEIFINGKSYGMTPIKSLAMPAGTYTIRFLNADQGIDAEQTVTLNAGEEKKVIRR